MTQPLSEDYIFQMPICSQQVNNLNLDLLRAGARGRPTKNTLLLHGPLAQ